MFNLRIHRIHYLVAITLFLLLSLSLPQAQARENSSSEQYTILIMGDSISAGFGIDKQKGWVALLEQKLAKESTQYTLINASISGETSSGGANRMAKLLKQHKPNLVIIELGGNDGLRGSPIKLIKQNLSYMIQQSKRSDSDVLLLGMRIPPNYGQTYSQMFADQYKQIATEHNVDLVPFLLKGIAGVDGMMQADGIHPTEPAQMIMLKWVYEGIKNIKIISQAH
jgi:acyl-CoA thioesterase-1